MFRLRRRLSDDLAAYVAVRDVMTSTGLDLDAVTVALLVRVARGTLNPGEAARMILDRRQ